MHDFDANPEGSLRRPSALWTVLAVLTGAAALGAALSAFTVNDAARRPIGEGELFRDDARTVAAALDTTIEDADLRRLRNRLTIESIGLVDIDGTVALSTSSNRVGRTLDSVLLAGFAEGGRFGAAAVPLTAPILVDGIEEWSPGDVVYEVVQPLEDGRALILTYDISELLARRSAARVVPTRAIELLTLAAVLTVIATALFVARGRVMRAFREFKIESEFLKRESAALIAHNRALDDARRRAERAYELAEEKNRIRSEFVLMINHELRTPLTGVVTGAELLFTEGAVTDPTWHAVLEGVVQDGARLREMIDQILAVARIENRALIFELGDVEATEVISRLSDMHAELTLPAAHDVDSMRLRTDPSSLARLVETLAANARDHGAARVTLSVHRDEPFEPAIVAGSPPDDAVYFVVEDDGPGISHDFLPRIFEKFEKDSRSSGTGLGLYIARMVVEALEGSIGVVTNGSGSRFAVAVPAAPIAVVTA